MDDFEEDLFGTLGENEAHRDIDTLLQEGYAFLDGFVYWLENRMGIDTRTAQQHCFNAESLVDYLANHHHISALGVDEFSLRWFVFSHYIRKSIADRETKERLLASLDLFYAYLRAEQEMNVPDWVAAILDDIPFYLARLRSYEALDTEDEADWKQGFRDWCDELKGDLEARCLWLPDDMGEGMEWGEQSGWREAALRDEANRLWQQERANLLRDGLHYEAIREHLTVSYLMWMDYPQPKLDHQTPRQTVREERRERELDIEDDDGLVDEI